MTLSGVMTVVRIHGFVCAANDHGGKLGTGLESSSTLWFGKFKYFMVWKVQVLYGLESTSTLLRYSFQLV
jgi:hypothetical protein